MGFWGSFLGHTAVSAINDAKKHDDLCYQLTDYEIDFNNYLDRINCPSSYMADWGCIDTGSISGEKRKIDTCRRKVEQYIELGGDPQYLDVDEIDGEIQKVKYLKSINQLSRQNEFHYRNMYEVQEIIESEQEEFEQEQEILRQEEEERRQQQLSQIIGTDINTLSGIEFENVCQQLVQNMGFETETTKASGDGGIDLICYNRQPLLSGKYIIQCKRYTGSVGEPIIRDLYGVVTSERANKGILMTTGYFTKSAIAFAEGKPIELIDGTAMQDLFMQYGLVNSSSENATNNSPRSFQSNIKETLGENIKGFFEEKWDEFESKSYTFDACLDDLIDTVNLRERVESIDAIISGLKIYEAYLMASKMPEIYQSEMFGQILSITDIEQYNAINTEGIYYALQTNEDGFRDSTKNTVLPTEDYQMGLFWTIMLTASDGIQDYSYIQNLILYHMQYLLPLATCVQCFTEEDVIEELTLNYTKAITEILVPYLADK